MLLLLVACGGCAKYNIYYNAKKAFDDAEHIRNEALKKNEDPPPPTGSQKAHYDTAIEKAQRVLEEYPGHSLTDDALFLQAKSWHRLESYRMSIRKLDLLFQNFPATPYLEEALYLQGLNYLLIGAVPRSQDYLDQMVRNFPDSDYRAEVLKVTGDNAYSLESWQEAADSYRQYLDQDVAIKERDRIGIKLAESYWELEDYRSAAAVLQEISQTAESRDLRFRAVLLQARVHVRMGDFEVVDVLLEDLKTEAEVYKSRGDVNLVEAENFIAQDRVDEATPLLENMPDEWEPSAAVKARAQEILGHQYLAASKWFESRKAYRTALNRPKDLDDEAEVRRLSEHLNVFLAALRSLTDAAPEEVSRSRLLLANGFRFGFGRPRKAAAYYRLAARDTAAEPTVAARALYGAYLTYRDVLDLPDSAAIFAAELDSLYPDSPQAFEARQGGSSNLLGYLLELRDEDRAANFAALSDSERVALTRLGGPGVGTGGGISGRDRAYRRRMVYCQRRDHLLFPPTEAETARHEQRIQRRTDAAARAAAADTSSQRPPAAESTGVPGAGAVPPPEEDAGGGVGPPVTPERAATGEESAVDPLTGEETVEPVPDEEEEEEEEEAPKKEVFDLRAPGPAP
ncbi:MAG: tetratricopeptide repeat protein [bacterium]|nr:tetratricopeptide repeat protein [bacterium]